MKKILSLILVLVLLISACACGKRDVENTTTTTTTTTTNATTTTETTTEETTEPTTENEVEKDETIKNIKKDTFKYNSKEQVVYYPENLLTSTKKYPVIVWANGTGVSYDFYESLLIELAKGGYIVVGNTERMSADGTAQINSLDFIISENSKSSSIFYNKVETEKIGFAGHSQGGRSSVNAAASDSRVKCVLSLAGSNYVEEAEKLSTPTFFIAGTNDMIVNADQWLVTAYNACQGPAVYASLKSAIHTTCSTNPEKYSTYAIAWFDAWLKNDSTAKGYFKTNGKLSKDTAWVDFKTKGI
jgi:dipeptidyl aminopeptidase/acylaminoacyl peptidase